MRSTRIAARALLRWLVLARPSGRSNAMNSARALRRRRSQRCWRKLPSRRARRATDRHSGFFIRVLAGHQRRSLGHSSDVLTPRVTATSSPAQLSLEQRTPFV
ncbi:hypothetical protein PF005_g9160 [Phytophthora fragariae]|uniref:Secreted protein n=1 Tax=Phytophthora fragariae TaxID=53985 RepID=A0A6A3ZMZ6_9STRA|nr:hypothetical protein PF003_g5167 [Phytophthora fragariae]KAE8944104.1 hypothetical protein PF009_g6191 [Phytophthora fragariae]KAE9014385.1 hypothetical protein PF011_g8065 [Phytophthora fragariae]KAE9117842.1 hypothetical protein PF010_g8442 [Phytophthora fragariae]KAE9127807.1 hypothetical protein PF007_g5468 [Phytophthora fragariae]